MAKEFNIFDQEAVAVEEQYMVDQPSPPLPKPKPQIVQPDLPGIPETIQSLKHIQNQEKLIHQHAKRIIEALFFSSSEALPFNKIREVLDTFQPLAPKLIRDLIRELQQEYLSQRRSFRLEEIAQGFLLRTCEEYSPFIDILYRNKRAEKLSPASAEVLAIIAYKNPITRPQIEAIRGVDCSGIVQNLLERQLIEPVGRLEAPGRPTLYATTKDFLKHFGLKDLHELPTINNGN